MTAPDPALDDPFGAFKSEVQRSFGFLTDQGFRLTKTATSYRDAVIEFSCGEVTIGIGYELASQPWVYVELPDTTGRRRGIGLHTARDDALGTNQVFKDDGPLPEQLDHLADATRKFASDLLMGRIDRLPRLMKLQAADVREMNRTLFGTSTGETPRFTGKPSLGDLFGDARGSDMADARAYQAIWDYGYSPDEVADYLETTTSEVERMLLRWEEAVS